MRVALLAAVLGALATLDCSSERRPNEPQPSPQMQQPAKLAAHWKGPYKTGLGTEWRYIRDSDGRFMAEISQDPDQSFWYVWRNGGREGEFETKEQAIKHAEEVVERGR